MKRNKSRGRVGKYRNDKKKVRGIREKSIEDLRLCEVNKERLHQRKIFPPTGSKKLSKLQVG